MVKFCVCATLMLTSALGHAIAPGQAESAAPDSFEAAAIKQPAPGRSEGNWRPAPGRFEGFSVSLHDAVAYAYEVEPRLVSASESWMTNERFDIVARPSSRDAGRFPSLLRQLLIERFALVTARRTRPMPVFLLERDRTDGSFGPGLKMSTRVCRVGFGECAVLGRPGFVRATGIEWGAVLSQMTAGLERRTLDRTGIAGKVDLSLQWNPSLDTPAPGGGPSIFTAVREQLGLRLVAAMEPLETVVITSASRPTLD